MQQACHTSYAVTAHLGLGAVGVEHTHSVVLVLPYHKQHTIASPYPRMMTHLTGKGRHIGHLSHPYQVDHYKLVARAVTLKYLNLHRIQNLLGFKNTNISLAKQIFFSLLGFSPSAKGLKFYFSQKNSYFYTKKINDYEGTIYYGGLNAAAYSRFGQG
jgi:hypothetical protein